MTFQGWQTGLAIALGVVLAGCSPYRKPEAEIAQDIYRICPIGMDMSGVESIARQNGWQFGGEFEGKNYFLGSYVSWPGEVFCCLLPDSMRVYANFTFSAGKMEKVVIRKHLDGP